MKRKVPVLLLIICMLTACLAALRPPAAVADPGTDTKSMLDRLFGKEESGDAAQPAERGGQNGGAAAKDRQASFKQRVTEENYMQTAGKWQADGVADAPPFRAVIHPRELSAGSGKAPLVPVSQSYGYGEKAAEWKGKTPEIRFTVDVPADGLYCIEVDYLALPGKIAPVERGIKINGKYPYFEARRLVFPRQWKDESETFQQDQLGNEVFSKQIEVINWQTSRLMDASYMFDEPLKFYLKKGSNSIALTYIREPMLVGRIGVYSPETIPDYREYARISGESPADIRALAAYEAEKPYVKSDSYIQATASADISVVPNRGSSISLNTLGGDSWKHGGQSVTWKIDVEQSGYYELAFKYTQSFKVNMPVFRKLLIDGKVPFREVAAYAFPYAADWENEVLTDAEGTPFKFYLAKGEHELTLAANPSPYQRVNQTVRDAMKELNDLNLEIKMATGNTQDVYRDWDITEQMPDIADTLNSIAGRLRAEHDYLRRLSGTNPDDARQLIISAEQLEKLAQDPASLPVRFGQLSEGSGSVTQKLGDLLLTLPKQPLQLDRFYVYANEKLPQARAGWWQKATSIANNFFTSFTKDYTQVSPADDDTLRIWVNRPRQYVMLMQQLANQTFTEQTGIKVSLSLMPNEQKLILANASGASPDVALGVSEKFPYEFALRGALSDLSRHEDYAEVVQRFAPGAMLPFMFDGGVYALPETQNFWVLYYRKDILDALNLKAPETWTDVLQTLPDLQRYGMNFYVPLADAGAMKSFALTSPFIYQQGGELFAPDGTKTVIDSERALDGFKMMTSLFTIYNMPLQVPNFYNHFRSGKLPIGISNYNTYVELSTAAPELNGSWKIAPYPGIAGPDGEVVRWAPGTGQGAIVFKDSDKQQQAWQFVKWWTSAETQTEFGNLIETIYGPAYRWNSANLEAFSQLPWPEEDLQVILEQWKWLKDIPHIPGDYMLDRELSNAWNKVVFDGKNPRKTIEDAVVLANREIMKKLEEFGYVRNGQAIRKLKVPTIEEVTAARGDAK
ncbi:extracellular solute-binding protein [Paenibacillus sp. GCM10027626]|uniref:extracellular solute-binding protein n=1 Tax=Paenibacillus sp. GCM10027626 TaxID=3273411 RepID=UPI00362B6022